MCAPLGAHSGKSAAGLASLGAYAQQCAPGGAVDGASWVIPSAAPPSRRRRKPPACGGPEAACGRDGPKGLNFNLRRKATCIDSTTKSRATTQLGTLEELRSNARSDPTPRRERGPPIDRAEDRRATTARPLEAGHEDGVTGKRLHLWRKGHAEGRPMWAARPGRSFVPPQRCPPQRCPPAGDGPRPAPLYLILGQIYVMAQNLSFPDWCEAPLPRPFVKAESVRGFRDLTPLHAASSWRPWMPVRGQDARSFCRVKRYPCAPGHYEVMACSEPIFRPEGGLESRDRAFWAGDAPAASHGPQKAAKRPPAAADAAANRERSMRRAASQMRDICLSTPFRYFVTLTLDPAKIDRHDMEALTRVLNRWADNRVRRNGLAYVLVPERHKDGAIHLHGFFTESVQLLDSGTMKLPGAKRPRRPRDAKQRAEWEAAGAKPVYNIPGWTLGFSTAIPLDGAYEAAVAYCCKYVRKAAEKIGGRWFYRGGKLGKPVVEYAEVDVNDVAACEGAYTFTAGGHMFALLRGRGVETCVPHPEESSLQFSESEIAAERPQAGGCGASSHDSKSEKEEGAMWHNENGVSSGKGSRARHERIDAVKSAGVQGVFTHGPAGQRRFVAAPVANREAILDCGAEDGEAAPGEFAGQVDFGAAFGIRWD